MIEILNTFPVKNLDKIAYRIINRQTVIVNLKENTLNTLNSTGTRIWKLTDGKISVKSIIEKMYREFEIDRDKLKKDCIDFVNQMVDKGLMIISSCPSGGE